MRESRESGAGQRSVRRRHGSRLLLGASCVTLAAPGGLDGQQSDPDEAVCPAYEARLGTPMETVRYLADDALGGRFSGSPGERCAGEYIAAMFASLGLEPGGEDGFFQELPLASAAQPHAPPGRGRNVVAILRGSDPELRGSAVVVGAHYDHLGLGEWLGTVPDFTPVDFGVLLAGVSEGSPAADGGLARGDILVGLGDRETGDLQAFTDALSAHRPGDEVVLRYLRDGEEHEATVRLGDRADRPQ